MMDRSLRLFMVVATAVAIFATGMLVYQVARTYFPTERAGPLDTGAAASIKPEKSILCAGDPLVFTVTVTLESAPISTDFIANIWSVAESRRIRTMDDSENNSIYLPQDIGQPVTRTTTITDTATLTPGRYEFRRFTQSQGYVPQAYFVPFEIEACP